MMVPLRILAFFAIAAGLLNLPVVFGVTPLWEHWFEPVFGAWQAKPQTHSHALEWLALGGSAVLALAGIGLAWALFGPGRKVMPEPAGDIGAVQIETPVAYRSTGWNFLFRAWKFDPLYNALFVRPFRILAGVAAWVDKVVVDGLYELLAAIVRGLHALVVSLQNGRVSRYALVMLFGAVAVTAILAIGFQR
jgi:NADH-quinone oxidoreductase subunit L